MKNETNNTIKNQTDISGNATQKENQSLQNSTKEKETGKVENNPNKNQLNNYDTLVKQNETSRQNQGKNFLQKSFNYLAQQDMNFYIIVICVFVVILVLIGLAIFIFIWRKNRKKRYTKFNEAVPQNANANNISVVSSNDSEIKDVPQPNA